MKKSKKSTFRFAMFMTILISLFWVSAYQYAKAENVRLSGVILLDKSCQGETCEKMNLKFFVNRDGSVILQLFKYRAKGSAVKSGQIPSEYLKSILKVLQKEWPETSLASSGQDATFAIFKTIKKDPKLMNEGHKIIEDIGRAIPNSVIIGQWSK